MGKSETNIKSAETQWPCRLKSQEQWCDFHPRLKKVTHGDFMGHTCDIFSKKIGWDFVVTPKKTMVQGFLEAATLGEAMDAIRKEFPQETYNIHSVVKAVE